MNRTLRVVRMQLINRQTYVWVPLLVLGGAFILSVAIWWILAGSGVTGNFYGGGAQAPLWYLAVVGVQALTLTFPFSQAMSVTRREFFFGTYLIAALSAASLAVVFVIGGWIETLTGGWGLNGYFFYSAEIWQGGPLGAAFIFFAIATLMFTLGFTGATVYKRFGPTVFTVSLIGLGVVLVAAMFVVGRLNAWGQVFSWIGEQGPLGMAAWGLIAAAALAAAAFATLRRATP